MFCENCGTRVEDGQPFCPNCGNKMPVPEAPAAPAAPVDPGYDANVGYMPPVPAMKEPKSTGGLLVLCALLSLLKVFTAGYGGYPMEAGSVFFTRVITVLFTLSITFFVLDYFDWFNFKFLWFFIAGAAATIFLIFVIMWIDSGCRLTVGGWFFLLLQSALTAAAIMLLIEKLKKK